MIDGYSIYLLAITDHSLLPPSNMLLLVER